MRKRTIGRLLLSIAAAAWTVSSIAIFTDYENGAPSWTLIFSITATVASICGALLIARTRGGRVGLTVTFVLTGLPFVIGLTLIKTGWGGDPNIGVGGILFVGLCLQPVSAVIAAFTLVVDVARAKK